MNIITQLNTTTFSLNGVPYLKNYISVVKGDKVEIFNCYERKDVLVPLTDYTNFEVNGSVYDSAAELQQSLLTVIYYRSTLNDGEFTIAQNNVLRFNTYAVEGTGPVTPTQVAAHINTMSFPLVISEIETPAIIHVLRNNKRYQFIFSRGKGSWGSTIESYPNVHPSDFKAMAPTTLTGADITTDPNNFIIPLGEIPDGNYVLIANQDFYDFEDSGEEQPGGGIKTYYFNFSINGEFFWAKFKSTPDTYGAGGSQLFTIEDFDDTVSEETEPDITHTSQLINNGSNGTSPYSTVANVNGLSLAVNQAAAEMYLKNAQGETLATINVGFLNNEGTTFFYNEATGNLELKNDAGTVLTVVPVSAFVENIVHSAVFNTGTPSQLNFKDAEGNTAFSVSFAIGNIAGLAAALSAKANDTDVLHKTGSETKNGSLSIDVANGNLSYFVSRNGTTLAALGSGSGSTGLNGILQLFDIPGVENVRIYASGNSWLNGGNVGINTASPTERLDVNGTSRFRNTVKLDIDNSLGFGNKFYFTNRTDYGGLALGNSEVSSANLFIKDSDGYVSILTNSPDTHFDVNGNIQSRGAFYRKYTNPGTAAVPVIEDVLAYGGASIDPASKVSKIKAYNKYQETTESGWIFQTVSPGNVEHITLELKPNGDVAVGGNLSILGTSITVAGAGVLTTNNLTNTVADGNYNPVTSIGVHNALNSSLADKADLISGKVPASQLPAYVDDVIEVANFAALPATGESDKIYITIDTNKIYRWGGSAYVVVSDTLALGETSSTAHRGDHGASAYIHSNATGNPHNTQINDISGLSTQLSEKARITGGNDFVGDQTIDGELQVEGKTEIGSVDSIEPGKLKVWGTITAAQATLPEEVMNLEQFEGYFAVNDSIPFNANASYLNSTYGDRKGSFKVYAPSAQVMFVKLTDSSSSDWLKFQGELLHP